MRQLLTIIVAECGLGLASQVLPTARSEKDGSIDGLDSCQHHLHALVMYLEETAQLEGQGLRVQWRRDGSVMLRYDDFWQYMWCQDGELHVDCRDPSPEGGQL